MNGIRSLDQLGTVLGFNFDSNVANAANLYGEIYQVDMVKNICLFRKFAVRCCFSTQWGYTIRSRTRTWIGNQIWVSYRAKYFFRFFVVRMALSKLLSETEGVTLEKIPADNMLTTCMTRKIKRGALKLWDTFSTLLVGCMVRVHSWNTAEGFTELLSDFNHPNIITASFIYVVKRFRAFFQLEVSSQVIWTKVWNTTRYRFQCVRCTNLSLRPTHPHAHSSHLQAAGISEMYDIENWYFPLGSYVWFLQPVRSISPVTRKISTSKHKHLTNTNTSPLDRAKDLSRSRFGYLRWEQHCFCSTKITYVWD